jgi:muconolactone delta-isomerase
METMEFFIGGGGFGVIDIDDSAELQRIIAEHPFTLFADVEIRPVVDPDTGLRTLQDAFAARAGAGA